MKFLSDRQVSERYAVSRATIWRWVRDCEFPAPIKFQTGSTRWKLADLEAWEAKQEGAA